MTTEPLIHNNLDKSLVAGIGITALSGAIYYYANVDETKTNNNHSQVVKSSEKRVRQYEIENSNEETWTIAQKKSDEYQVGSLNIQSPIDEYVIYICQEIFNKDKCKPHRYSNMHTFLSNCIKLTDNILDLIHQINNLINEKSNYYHDIGIFNTIDAFFKEFKCNCETIHYFNKNQINANLLNELYNILSNYLKSKYYTEDDFKNSDNIYSDIQLNWTLIKINLVSYQKMKDKEYQKIMFSGTKRIGFVNQVIGRITDFFSSPEIEGTLTLHNNYEPSPIINNRIVWKGNEINLNNQNQRMITA